MKKETRGRKSKADRIAEDEPLCHSPPKPQTAAAAQQQMVKVKKARINWSKPENQEMLKKTFGDWEAAEEKVRSSFLAHTPPLLTHRHFSSLLFTIGWQQI